MPTLLLLSLTGCLKQPVSASSRSIEKEIAALTGGGSSEWDGRIEALLLSAYDKDGSGIIERPKELEAIPCSVWRAIDAGLVAGGEYTAIRSTYGFADGYLWVGDAFGISDVLRAEADAKLVACGLPE